MIYKHAKYVKDRIQGKAPVGKLRSSHWPTVRKHFIQSNPTCAACGGTEKLEVHHILPFHLNPELELDPNNLIALCESDSYGIRCHIVVGHNGDYKKINPYVKEDAAAILKKLKS